MLVPMRKATLIALQRDRDALLLALQRCGEFMAIETEAGSPARAGQDGEVQRIGAAIQFLESKKKKKLLFASRASIAFDDLAQERREAEALAEEVERLRGKIQAARAEAAALQAQAQALKSWDGLAVEIERIGPTASSRSYAGFVAPQNAGLLREEAEAAGAMVQVLGNGPEGTAVYLLCHAKDDAAVTGALKAAGFAQASFPLVRGTPETAIAQLHQSAEEALEGAEELEEHVLELLGRQDELKALYEQRSARLQRDAVQAQTTREVFFLQGWVRSDRQKQVQEVLETAGVVFDLQFEDPAPDEQPPTVVQNGPLVRPFEAVTDLYSRPSPFGYDPNAIMALFYFIFFGMMMSDAGYGLVTTALLLAAQWIMKPRGTTGKLVSVLLFGSISTVLWGFSFGGLFGISLPPLLFNPMEEPLKMLLLCYGMGLAHLFTGMAIKMVLLFRAGDWQGALFDQLSWIVLIVGCLLLALPATSGVGMVLAIIGAVTILLMAGRSKKNFFSRLTGGLGALYGITSYLSDVLSYSRIFALGLATGVIGMVINTIAGMLTQGSGLLGALGFVGAVFVLIGGHIFNIVINMLGAFVHTARLQYIEFFGKFYEPGGYEFKPLAVRPTYLDVTGRAAESPAKDH